MFYANQIEIPLDSGFRKMGVGIYSNCEVTSVEVGDRFIDFNYKNTDGEISNKRVWFPDITKITPKEGEDMKTALDRVTKQELGHIVKHMHIFLTPQEINSFSAPDFASFATKAAQMLTPKLKDAKVNLKLIYDAKGEFPTFEKVYTTYIEKYVEGQEPTIKFSKWEKENRLTKKEPETPKTEEGLLF